VVGVVEAMSSEGVEAAVEVVVDVVDTIIEVLAVATARIKVVKITIREAMLIQVDKPITEEEVAMSKVVAIITTTTMVKEGEMITAGRNINMTSRINKGIIIKPGKTIIAITSTTRGILEVEEEAKADMEVVNAANMGSVTDYVAEEWKAEWLAGEVVDLAEGTIIKEVEEYLVLDLVKVRRKTV
jgi:hypothetical protein